MEHIEQQAQVKISGRDLVKESEFFLSLGFKIQHVFPADNPRMMVIKGHGLWLRIENGLPVNDLTVILPGNSGEQGNSLYSPSGVCVQFDGESLAHVPLPEKIEFSVNQFNDTDSWVTGRAGMLYRDLIPSRLGGAIIASHILIPDGGPVPDHVHFHDIQFQLIFCLKGWVKVVYEDQGKPFILNEGDCVTQPPGIRHQVLESSDGLEVLEIGLAAEHMTTLDDNMSLPTAHDDPHRTFGHGDKAQTFCHHQQDKAEWQQWQHPQLSRCQTQVLTDCNGLAAVNVIRSSQGCEAAVEYKHHDALRFYYVFKGHLTLTVNGRDEVLLSTRDSFVLPAQHAVNCHDFSAGCELIEFIWIK